MRYMAFNVADQWTAVLDTEEKEVLIYDPRHKGDAPRGSRRQDQWTADGKFVASIMADTLTEHGNRPWNMIGYIDGCVMYADHVRYLRTWVQGVLAGGKFPTGDGMSFINNRWVYTGPSGYRVRERGELFSVVSYTANGERVVGPFGASLMRDDAYALAATLAHGK